MFVAADPPAGRSRDGSQPMVATHHPDALRPGRAERAPAMGEESEKRSEDRSTCDADIEWVYFNKPDAHAARLLNVSPSGGYFECRHSIIPGATILVRVHHGVSGAPDGPAGAPLRTAALAEVKWCRDLPDRSPAAFGIGIRYHLPV